MDINKHFNGFQVNEVANNLKPIKGREKGDLSERGKEDKNLDSTLVILM